MNDPRSMHKGYVIIGGNRFAVSLAINEDEQTSGLMYIEPPLTSMAFVYTRPQINKFWMKDVKDDLDILFCYKGRITQRIEANAQSTELLGADEYSDLVIEFPTNIAEQYSFDVGDDVKMSFSKEAARKLLDF